MDNFNIWGTPSKKKKKKQNNIFGGNLFGPTPKRSKNNPWGLWIPAFFSYIKKIDSQRLDCKLTRKSR